MNSRVLILIPALAFLAALPATAETTADAVLGKWYTDGHESQVEIIKEEKGGVTKYYGSLVWFKDPVYEADDPEAGKALRDRENPDKSKQNDPLLGLRLLKDFEFNEDDKTWDSGTIYDPEVGKTYKCVIRLSEEKGAAGAQKLSVRGYIGIPALGRTTEWEEVIEKTANN